MNDARPVPESAYPAVDRYDAVAVERDVLAQWERADTFQQSLVPDLSAV